MPRTPAPLDRFYHQKLHWKSCGRDRCTRLLVPLDYADPAGRTDPGDPAGPIDPAAPTDLGGTTLGQEQR